MSDCGSPCGLVGDPVDDPIMWALTSRGMASAPSDRYVVGIDFGTLSGRAVVVSTTDGTTVGTAAHDYRSGVIESELPASGERLPPSWALQDPADWLAVLAHAVPAAVRSAGVDPSRIVGIGTAFTASTPLPVLRDGTPLCQVEGFEQRPHAYPKLWKHHAAQRQAERITELAAQRGEPWLARYGGRISSEWELAKALQVMEEDPAAYDAADRWIEAADWIVWQLCGVETRNACTAGYKGQFQDGRYPSTDYFAALHPSFARFAADKLEHPQSPLGGLAGTLTPSAASRCGLPEGIAVAVGNVDAHVTAPAARAIEPGHMLAVMGTSTCHVMNGTTLADVPGMCGVVDGGITPGLLGYEAGQSGVGDIFGWFVERQVPPEYHEDATRRGLDIHELLSELAAEQTVGAHGLVALDWHSGNRSVLVDHELSGAVVGLTLATRAEDIYRALVEATAFGTRKIVETFDASGVPVREFTVAGGLTKNPLVMQIYADVLRRPLHVMDTAEGPALGAALHAAVAAGVHDDIRAASAAMGKVRRNVYLPSDEASDAYDALYDHYCALHDHFGRRPQLMHALATAPEAAAARTRRGRRPTSRRLRSARRADALWARQLDERQSLGSYPRRRPDGDQGERRAVRVDGAGEHRRLRLLRQSRRGRPLTLERRRHTRLRLPAPRPRRRRRAHTQRVRDGICRACGVDSLRAHRDGRRVRRRDPGRPVCTDRRRRDRTRDRRDTRGPSLARNPHAQPRSLHDRRDPA